MKAGVVKRVLGVVTLLVGTVVTATLVLLIWAATTFSRQVGGGLSGSTQEDNTVFTIVAVIVALLTLVVTIALFRSASRDAERKPRGLDESA